MLAEVSEAEAGPRPLRRRDGATTLATIISPKVEFILGLERSAGSPGWQIVLDFSNPGPKVKVAAILNSHTNK